MERILEIRNISGVIEGNGRTISGYAIRFNEDSKNVGFIERIEPTAITQEQLDNSDIFAFFNHDQEKVLARTGANTLKLDLREDGLYYEFEAPNTQAGNDLVEHINRGEMYGTSFGFYTNVDGSDEEWDTTGETPIRTIKRIEELVEISPCFSPAYPTTSISKRALDLIEKYQQSNMKNDELEIRAEEDEVKDKEVEETKSEEQDEKVEEPKDERAEEDEESENAEEPKDEESEEPKEEEKSEDEESDKEEKSKRSIKRNKSKNKPLKNSMERKFSLLKAIRNVALNGKLDEYSQAVSNKGAEELRNAGLDYAGQIQIPVGQKLEERADNVVTVDAEGEHVVVTDFMSILEPLRSKNVLANAGAKYLTGLKGDVQIPTMGAEQVFWEGEITDAKDGSSTFTHVKLQPRRIAAFIDVSKQFIVQDTLGAENLIRQDLINALNSKLEATILSDAAADGNVPAGIFNGMTPEEISTFADVCNLEAEVEESNIYGEMKYILSPKAKAALRAMPKSEKHTQLVLDTATIDGTPFESTTHMEPNTLAYGDWSNLVIGQWGAIDITVDPYTQATKGCIRLVINAYFDYKVLRDGSIVYGTISED